MELLSCQSLRRLRTASFKEVNAAAPVEPFDIVAATHPDWFLVEDLQITASTRRLRGWWEMENTDNWDLREDISFRDFLLTLWLFANDVNVCCCIKYVDIEIVVCNIFDSQILELVVERGAKGGGFVAKLGFTSDVALGGVSTRGSRKPVRELKSNGLLYPAREL
jgi:hypothetical protein